MVGNEDKPRDRSDCPQAIAQKGSTVLVARSSTADVDVPKQRPAGWRVRATIRTT